MKVPNKVAEGCILDLNEVQTMKKAVDKTTNTDVFLVEMTFKNGIKETIYYEDKQRRDDKFNEFEKIIFQAGGLPTWAKEEAEKAKEPKYDTRGNKY